jgi:hypothetical protein
MRRGRVSLDQAPGKQEARWHKSAFFFCPGCKYYHAVAVQPGRNEQGATWSWNGDMEKPTFEPSVLTERGTDRQCHLFVRDGSIQFLSDCTHELAGQTVPMEDEDIGPHITEEGKCSACGHPVDLDDLKALDFQADRSGVQPSSPSGPAVHWAEGSIACPHCGARLPYSVSSD